jgi:hypothetical protein
MPGDCLLQVPNLTATMEMNIAESIFQVPKYLSLDMF